MRSLLAVAPLVLCLSSGLAGGQPSHPAALPPSPARADSAEDRVRLTSVDTAQREVSFTASGSLAYGRTARVRSTRRADGSYVQTVPVGTDVWLPGGTSRVELRAPEGAAPLRIETTTPDEQRWMHCTFVGRAMTVERSAPDERMRVTPADGTGRMDCVSTYTP